MEDTAVKEYFRAWMDKPERPWFVFDQYIKENPRPRGVSQQSERQAQAASPQQSERQARAASPQQRGYDERMAKLVEQKDYAGAAALQAQFEEAEKANEETFQKLLGQ